MRTLDVSSLTSGNILRNPASGRAGENLHRVSGTSGNTKVTELVSSGGVTVVSGGNKISIVYLYEGAGASKESV